MISTSSLLLRLTRRLLGSIPLAAWDYFAGDHPLVPYYHLVSDEDLPHVRHYRYKTSRLFEADVAFAHRRYRLLRGNEILDSPQKAGSGSRPGFLFTFDDGFVECFTTVRPILLRYRADAIFFVTIDLLDNARMFFESKIALAIGAVQELSTEEIRELVPKLDKHHPSLSRMSPKAARTARARLMRGRIPPPSVESRQLILWLLSLAQQDDTAIDDTCDLLELDWRQYLHQRAPYLTSEQLQTMAAEGFTVGAHSVSHARLQLLEPKAMQREIIHSCDRIRLITGQRLVPFAFPYSARGVNKAQVEEVRRAHSFIGPFFDTGGVGQRSGMVNRFWADSPAGAWGTRSNLPRLMKRSWSQTALGRR